MATAKYFLCKVQDVKHHLKGTTYREVPLPVTEEDAVVVSEDDVDVENVAADDNAVENPD